MESGNKKKNNIQSSHPKTGGKKNKKSKKHALNALKVFLLVCIVGGFLGVVYVYFFITSALDGLEPLDPARVQASLIENSVIVDSQGRVLETIQRDNLRTVIKYDDISQDMIQAIVAVEDRTFWEHNGFNIVRIFGAVRDSFVSGGRIGGTSTITQQLARNVFLFEIRSERDLGRKVQEAYYAIQLEKHLTKKQIIEGYLNLIFFGQGSYGIEAASETYFSKSASELDYIEAAMLAGVPRAPGVYHPMERLNKSDVLDSHYIIDDSDSLYTLVFNERSKNRYLTSLYLMHQNGFITDAEYAYGKEFDIRQKLNPTPSLQSEISSFFADMVKDEVVADLTEQYGYTHEEATNLLFTGGFVIESTIDFDMQKTLESHYTREDFTPYYGESTVVAVRNFQRDHGLSVDGSAGPATLGKLGELTGEDFSDLGQRSFFRGANDDEVTRIKKSLFSLGYMVTNENFPRLVVLLDGQGNILSEENRRILLYKKANMIDAEGNLKLPSSDYRFDESGNLVLLRNQRLNFYPHYQNQELTHIQVVLRDTFTIGENREPSHNLGAGTHTLTDVYMHQGRDLLIPNEYKSFDADRNVVIAARFLSENPEFFRIDASQNLLVEPKYYVMNNTGVIQPQSAMVIMDYRTGELKALVGGRNIEGQRMFNRATNPRQPGSAIKPLSVFIPAINSGEFTAATVVDDRPTYLSGDPDQRWPINWYEYYTSMDNYRGLVTLRESMEQSINVSAALIAKELGVNTSAEYLERFGVTSVIREGSSNDMNLAALALGGMTRGISPVELTNAYGAIANGGIINQAHTYKTVKTRNGELFLEKKVTRSVVVDENVAYIVSDLMRTGVDNGVATRAKLSPNNDIIPVIGKTGTTSSNIDAWFVGYTPYYVGGVWFGNDINIPLDQGSMVAASFWRSVMADVHVNLEPKNFEEPSGIVRLQVDRISGKLPSELSRLDPRGTVYTELFLRGTEPTEEDDVHVMVEICTESNLLAGPYCPTTTVEMRLFVKRPEPYIPSEHNNMRVRDMDYDMPIDYCDIHDEAYEEERLIEEEENLIQSFMGVQPRVTLANGVVVIQRPYPIILSQGQEIVLPAFSRIQLDGSILLPDGSIIQLYNIGEIPDYTTEELDLLSPTP